MSIATQSRRKPRERAPTKKTWGKKKCDNCNRVFVKGRKNQKFCKTKPDGTPSNCLEEFHRNRSAFGPLKVRIEGMIREHTKEFKKQISVEIADLRKSVKQLESRRDDVTDSEISNNLLQTTVALAYQMRILQEKVSAMEAQAQEARNKSAASVPLTPDFAR
jgi:hypothetical protein